MTDNSARPEHETNQSKVIIRVWSGNPNERFEEILHKYDTEEYEANVIANMDQIPSDNHIVLTEDQESVGKYLFEVDTPHGEGEQDETSNAPLAGHCSLCGDGYNPNLEISISDEPTENTDGKLEYRWIHKQCKRDHDRFFAEAEPDDGWDLPA